MCPNNRHLRRPEGRSHQSKGKKNVVPLQQQRLRLPWQGEATLLCGVGMSVLARGEMFDPVEVEVSVPV